VTALQQDEDRYGPGVRLHPPLIYGISILSGIGLDNLYSLAMPFGLHGNVYGGFIITIAIALALWSLIQFHREGTDVRPDRPDDVLLTSGPYRFTRNPLYIVLTLAQVTAAVWLDSLWVLLLTPVSVIVISRYAIAREERYLEKLFGQDYLDYKKRVRRWL
jgi:protein-S-isoprenylcysteine O-methyltransferase Ste14